MKIIITQNDVINRLENNLHRIGVPYQSQIFEITGVSQKAKIDSKILLQEFTDAKEIDFAEVHVNGISKRCIQHDKNIYYNEELEGPISDNTISSHALLSHSISADLTEKKLEQINNLYNGITGDRLKKDGKYIHADKKYWIPTEKTTFDAINFYQATAVTDAMENKTTISYDKYGFFAHKITDALNNITIVDYDYAVLKPYKTTDPNNSIHQVEFDSLGMVIKEFVAGTESQGDTLDAPTIMYNYGLKQWADSKKPVYSHIITREFHKQPYSPSEIAGLPIMIESYVYTGGHGNKIMTKVRAEKFATFKNDDGITTKTYTFVWLTSGRTVFNNKGNAIKQYEPYYSDTHVYQAEESFTGVSSIFYYDPIGRNIKTEFPDGTFTKVEFTPWQIKKYDQNDTVLDSQWYEDSGEPAVLGSEPTDPQKRAAWLAAQHANTPQVTHLDNLGREYQIDDDNGTEGVYTVHYKLDILGRQIITTDPMGRKITTITMGMKQAFVTENIDSGTRAILNDVQGKPVYSWDSRNHEFKHTYDALNRPLTISLKDKNDTSYIIEKTVYGTISDNNSIGQIIKQYDQSGLVETVDYDFKGNPLKTITKFAKNYKSYIDWNNSNCLKSDENIDGGFLEKGVCLLKKEQDFLNEECYTHTFTYDALNRPITKTTPNKAESNTSTPENTLESYTYNKQGLLSSVTHGAKVYVKGISYNPKGQRTDIYYGNNSKTKYEYDGKTFRLTRILTTSDTGAKILMDLNYIYDAVGNITQQLSGYETEFNNNTEIVAQSKYTYDAIYRLVGATGRELSDLQKQNEAILNPNITLPIQNNNGIRNYYHNYTYNKVGNIIKINYNDPSIKNKNFNYGLNENNYLIGHAEGETKYTYDAHGNMLTKPGLQALNWDCKNQLSSVGLTKSGDKAYYVYNAAGERVRKVITEKYTENGEIKERIVEERYYLGNTEFYSKFANGKLTIKSRTNHIMDDTQRIATINTQLEGDTPLTTTVRYQYANHLGSACLELDETAKIISYQEYHPYGSIAYSLHKNDTDVNQQRYKFTGKERDSETGLDYFGARYYSSDLSIWLSVDPLASKYPSMSPYMYVAGNPINLVDPDGKQIGDFINENGKKIGNDGLADGKVYIIKTSQTEFDGDGNSAGISTETAQRTEDFIANNSGNTEAFESNNIAYENSIEIEGNALTRMAMVFTVGTDNGEGGTAPGNNTEVGATIDFIGNVGETVSGDVADPTNGGASVDFVLDGKNYKSRFHLHPSGTKKNAQGKTRWFNQAPSAADINNAGHRTNYVFGKRGSGKVYVYDGDGIKATIPMNSFIFPKN